MKRILPAALFALATVAIAAAYAQVNSSSLPANTVVGRLGVGSGPAQAIPFATLGSQLAGTTTITGTGDVSFSGPASGTTTTLNNIPNDTTLALDILATNATAPATPASGKTRVYVDSTQKVLSAKNDAGTVSVTVIPNVASAFQFVTGVNSAGALQTATIDGQVNNGSPPSTGEVMIWNPNTVQWEKTTIANIGSSSGVASIAGQVGALSLGAGLTNSTTTLLVDPSYMQSFIGGLVMSNDAGTPNTVIDSAAGAAVSDDATTFMKAGAFTKNANAAWAVGAATGCLDSGTGLILSTWYHLYVIERTDTGIVDEFCSMAPPSLTQAVTSISNASPAIITLANHGLQPGQPVKFTTTGGLPTGLTVGTQYWVISANFSSSQFEVSASCTGTGCTTGTAVNTSSAGSGTHSVVTAPILPANYTKKRRIGSFKTDATVHILAFKQRAHMFYWTAPTHDISTSSQGATSINYVMNVPPGTIAWFSAEASQAAGALRVRFKSTSEADVGTSVGLDNIENPAAGVGAAGQFQVQTDTSSQITIRSNGSNTNVDAYTNAWFDPLDGITN